MPGRAQCGRARHARVRTGQHGGVVSLQCRLALLGMAKGGRVDVVLKALRERWATMPSVLLNNTLQEDWTALPDSGSQWSHCAVAPLYVFFMSVAGLTPLAPGFRRVEIRPQPGDLESLELTAHTMRGPIEFRFQSGEQQNEMALTLPADCEGELVVPTEATLSLAPLPERTAGLARYRVPLGSSLNFSWRKT